MKTQQEIIREYLLKGKEITGTHALINWGIRRLSSVISILKKEGLEVKSRRKKKDFGIGSYSVYFLEKEYIKNYIKTKNINFLLKK